MTLQGLEPCTRRQDRGGQGDRGVGSHGDQTEGAAVEGEHRLLATETRLRRLHAGWKM